MLMVQRLSLVFLVVAGLGLAAGCDDSFDLANLDDSGFNNGDRSEDQANPAGQTSPTGTSAEAPHLIIGSFNIQTFGKSKMGKPDVVNILVDIVRRFDILAIQELRDGDQKVIYEFLELVNQDGARFKVALGDRQGYVVKGKLSSYFEQAVYIYDSTKVVLLNKPYVSEDRHKRMHRSPYVAHFRCLGHPPEQAFSFVLMNVHTDPDDVMGEFEAMVEIIRGVYANHQEDDFILLGDLNGNPTQFASIRWMAQTFAAIPSGWMTNTRQTKNYDNIVFDANNTAEFSGQSGVLDLMSEYRLTKKDALRVSDHMPVWAVFSTVEAPSALFTENRSNEVVR